MGAFVLYDFNVSLYLDRIGRSTQELTPECLFPTREEAEACRRNYDAHPGEEYRICVREEDGMLRLV